MYKRQSITLRQIAFGHWNFFLVFASFVVRELFLFPRLFFVFACANGPVSYTHLDVYKRQATYLSIVLLCVFNNMLLGTRLGQNMRTVGHSRVVANVAGINVDRTRIIAMVLSTVLACWGQLIYLQNIGTFATYAAHTQVSLFAIAALLVGGASIQKATNSQAIIGVILFHTLFIVAPQAGTRLFRNPQLGEYFRVFVAYGVIAVSLAMHAWKSKPRTAVSGKVEDTPDI